MHLLKHRLFALLGLEKSCEQRRYGLCLCKQAGTDHGMLAPNKAETKSEAIFGQVLLLET